MFGSIQSLELIRVFLRGYANAFLKRVIDSTINKLGYNVTKLREKEPIASFNVLRLVLNDYISHDSQFFFIQVGANDGIRWDPLRDFIITNDVPGILIEPLPDFFNQLKSNYGNQKNLIFEQAAISEHNGEKLLYVAKADAPVEDWVHGVASFDKQHVLTSTPPEYIETVTVSTITPEALINKYNISHLELLQIDTEGYDFEVLKCF